MRIPASATVQPDFGRQLRANDPAFLEIRDFVRQTQGAEQADKMHPLFTFVVENNGNQAAYHEALHEDFITLGDTVRTMEEVPMGQPVYWRVVPVGEQVARVVAGFMKLPEALRSNDKIRTERTLHVAEDIIAGETGGEQQYSRQDVLAIEMGLNLMQDAEVTAYGNNNGLLMKTGFPTDHPFAQVVRAAKLAGA